MKNKIGLLLLCWGIIQNSFSQNVGIGTTSPSAKLDINGDIAMRSEDIDITAVYNYALDVNSVKQSNYKLLQTGFPPVGNFIIAGITSGVDGRVITLANRSGSSLEIYNDDAGALAADRVITGTGTVFAVYSGGAVTLKYDTASQRWEVIGSHYNNLNYFGSASSWNLNGNAGTNPSINFIGTTDNDSLQFKINNIKAGIIDNANNNVALGMLGLASNTTGIFNTAFGDSSLGNNTTGSYNTGSGTNSLQANTNGWNNAAFGSFSLYYNTSGSYNCAYGYSSLGLNVSGAGNAAFGAVSLFSNTTGQYNAVLGSFSMNSNTTGLHNSSLGSYSLGHNTIGIGNSAAGYQGLYGNTVGNFNTCIGYKAFLQNQTGSWNTGLGENTNTSASNINGATAIGTAAISNADNKIVLGANIAGMVIGGYANWSNLSDGRFKNNVNENVPGLDFVKQLRPVSYTIDIDKLQHFITAQMPDSMARNYYPTNNDIQNANSEIKTGFIAQEVEAIVKKSAYLFDGVNAPKNPTDNYSIAYSQFVVPLVKAVQELSKKNDDQDKIITDLQKQVTELILMITK